MAVNKIKNRHRYRSMFFMRTYKKPNTYKKNNCSTVIIPVKLSLDISTPKERGQLIKAIKEIYALAMNNNKICIDFSSTQVAFIDGMLYFFSEIKNIKNIYPHLQLTCKKSRTSRINHLLKQIGLFRLFKVKFKKTRQFDNVDSWVSFSGNAAIEHMYQALEEKFNLSKELNSELYRGCLEATINSHSHAYIEERLLSKVDNNKEAWWLFAEMRDRNLSVAICDLGVGIAKTLPTKYPKLDKLIKIFYPTSKDADVIKLAMTIPNKKSRTKLPFRGNGLNSIHNVTKTLPNSYLKILSYKAYLYFHNGVEKCEDSKTIVPATIIMWNIPLGCTNHE